MSFTAYLKEQEELKVKELELSKKEKVADFIRTIEDLSDSKFHDFAVKELGMEEDEAETIVYKMLRDFLLAGDKDEDGIPDELMAMGDEEGVEGEEEPIADELPDEDEDMGEDY